MAHYSPEIYHERQRLWLCGQHAVNSLLQAEVYTKSDMDKIAETLNIRTDVEARSWLSYYINPHKSIIIGNYDVNVIIEALSEQGLETRWFDVRKDIRTDIQFTDRTLFGLILNTRTEFLCFPRHHWIAIKPIFGEETHTVYNLDSRLTRPKSFDNEEAVYSFLEKAIHHEGGQLLVVKIKQEHSGSDNELTDRHGSTTIDNH
ncbi:8794_t:CDS:2 [Paraglomus occultum]|uniref:ubiquitinyl hydrolase 1 n=1 Tax=Paraglomus occultum TaxID=144539 RepID=A0A9N8ZHP8_9GLOM|nr:8794_t:CDS:2 [Paraglomus occultum]